MGLHLFIIFFLPHNLLNVHKCASIDLNKANGSMNTEAFEAFLSIYGCLSEV